MHILQINTEKGWRGGERQTLLSMEGLRDARVNVSLLCLENQPLATKARAAGFPVVAVKNQAGALLHCIFAAKKYSLLHAQSSRAFGFAAIATFFMRTPLVYTRRVDFVPQGFFTRCKYRRTAALVAISVAIRDILQESGMGNAVVISSIVSSHNPDTARQANFSKEQNLEGKKVVGVVAALVGHKDPLTMVRAASRVCKEAPETVFLHFGEGDLRLAVEQEIARMDIKKQYILCGHVSAVEDIIPLFNCFAMSSREEGLGSTVLDAFATGVPVASTDAGGLAELVEGRGLLSAKGDAEALAKNITRLLYDKPLSHSLANNAREYVVREHSREVITGKYLCLYERLSSRKSV